MSTIKANAYLDAAGGNTATINGITPVSLADVSSMTLLGTLTMTSGTSQTLSGLTLTNYKQLWVVYSGITLAASAQTRFGAGNITAGSTPPSSFSGMSWTELVSGFTSCIYSGYGNNNGSNSGYTTATTSVSISTAATAFTGGTVYIYGVK